MGYLIGAGPLDPAVKRYNGGTSSFTMDNSGTTNGTLLWVDGVAQVPGTDYNVSGTTITTTTAAGAGTNNVTSLQLFNTGLITTPADNTVAIAKIQDDAVTLAKMAAGTDGNIISYDSSGNPVAIATGNDGQVLTSAGAGAQPAFEAAAAGGAWTLIDSEEASTSSTVTLTGITSTYDMYFISCTDCIVSGDATDVYFRMGDSSGIDSGGSDYAYAIKGIPATGIYSTGAAFIALTNNASIGGIGNATGEGWSASLWIEYSQATKFNLVWGHVSTAQSPTSPHIKRDQGQRTTNILLTQVQFYMSSGTINSGRFSIWGISHA